MGRFLLRSLIANGLVGLPRKAEPEPAPRRRILLERLEDRLLFDAGPVAPVDVDAELAQAQAAQDAMPADSSIAEPAEVRLIETLDNLDELIADLTGSATNRAQELTPGAVSSGSATVDGATTSAIEPNAADASLAGVLLNSDEVARQLLTTSDEQTSELQAATADVRHELVFVDVSVEDYQTLLAGVDPRAEVVLLDANRDGIDQIAEVLSQRSGLNAIHIVSHGSMGELQLGQATLNLDSMHDRYAEQLGRIGQALALDADILIYGCNFAEGLLGRAAEESLAQLTGADVAASSDATGSAALGGDWELERSVGFVESRIAFGEQAQQGWQYLLAVLDWDTVDWTSGSLSQSFSVGGGTVSFSITGDTDDFFSGSPNDDTTNTGGLSPVEESVLLDMNFESQTTIGDEMVTVVIGFTHPGGVSNVSFTIFDVDLSTWTDQIIATANNGATINPSSVTVGSTVSFDGVNKVTGTASNASTSANGNATFTFNQTGITQITLVYQSGRLADPTEQYISLHDITFNVAPVLDLDASGAGTGFSNTFTEDGAAVRIADTDSLITDTDSTNLNRATITLTNPQTSDLLSVSGALPAGISLDLSSTSTLIVLTGSSSLANYETAIEQIRFSNNSQTPNTTARTITVTVQDTSNATSNTATSTISVVSVNDAPTGGNRTVTTAEDTDFTFTTADFPFSDVDGDPLTRVRIDTLPADGTVLLSGVAVTAGQIITVANITSGNLKFRPDANENGSPYTTFTFSVGEATTFAASPSTMTVNVTAVNDVPTGGNRTVTTAEDTDFTFTTSDFPFSDVDGTTLARVRINTLPTDGTVLLSGVAVTAGQIITVANITSGNLKFRPDANENGSPYTTFTFSVGDATTFAASTSTMTVNVTPVNDAPTGGNRSVTTAEDTDFTFSTSDFPFSDVDGGPLARVRIDTLPTDGTVLLSGVAVTAGQIITAANITSGNLKFRPDANENGSPYTTFTFSVGDASAFSASASTMTVNVTPVNDAPTGGNRTVTTAEDTDFTFSSSDFPFSDVDGGSLARVRIDSLPVDGTVLLSGVAVTAGQIITAANITSGNLKFRPDANENGSPYTTFTFSVGDASTFAASPSTMTVNVTPVNDAPTGGNRTVTTAEDTDFTFTTDDFPFSDVDGGSLARVRIDTLPVDGTVLLSGVAVTAGQIITAANITAGNLKFRPDANENGSPYTTFNFAVGDATTFVASPSTMTVNVTPVNDAPTGGNRTVTTAEDTDFSFATSDFPFSDVDGGSLARVRIDTLPVDGTVLLSGVAVTAGQIITAANITAGNLKFRPDANENGSPYTTFTFSVGDATNFVAAPSTMTVNVTPVNDPPVADDEAFTVSEGGSVIIPVLIGDTDLEGDSLTVTQIDGTAISVGSPVTIATGVVSLNADGTLTFAPSGNYNGPAAFDYTVSDGNGGSDIGNVSGSVTGVNDPPLAVADTATTAANAPATGNVLSNDSDPDGDTLTVSEVSGVAENVGAAVVGSNGGMFTINADGSYTFDPGTAFEDLAIGELRSTTVSYTASDGQGGTSSTTVTVTVSGTNNAPASMAIPDRVNDDSDVVTVDVSSTFSDPDASDVLTYSASNLPPTLSLNPATGVITGMLASNASASSPYSVTITATDLAGAFTSQTFQWVVNNVPVSAFDDFNSTTENVSATGSVLTNDVDPDGDPLVVAAVNGVAVNVGVSVSGSQGGSFVIETDGNYTFTPGTDFDDLATGETRNTSIWYTTDDGNGSAVMARLTVLVNGTNDSPTSTAIPAQASQDNDAVTFGVASHFTDPDMSDTLAFSASNLPAGLTIDPGSGVIAGTIDHSASVSSPYSVVITATDPFGATTSQTFNWIVTNPVPTAGNDTFTTEEDTPVSGSLTANDSDPDGDTLTYSLITPPDDGVLTPPLSRSSLRWFLVGLVW